MTIHDDPRQEGHTREWADRARVVIDAKEKVQEDASPRQSPDRAQEAEDVEERSDNISSNKDDEPVY